MTVYGSSFRGSSIIFPPTDDADSLIGPRISEGGYFRDTFVQFPPSICTAPFAVPGTRPHSQDPLDLAYILQVFATMIHLQDQDRIAGLEERVRFDTTIHNMVNCLPLSHLASITSPPETCQSLPPIGQYYPSNSVAPSSKFGQTYCSGVILDHTHPVYRNHQHSSSSLRASHDDDPPFLSALTKTSHCSKFKK
jgi:hypothetical protein